MSGVFISKTRLVILVVIVVILLIVEGLLIGLLARPSCDVEDVIDVTQTSTTSSTESTSNPGPTGPWSNIRLPEDLVPLEYSIDIRPVFEKDAEGRYLFYGTSSVTYSCVKETQYIIMHSVKLNYTKDDVTITVDGTEVAIKDLMFYEPNQFVVVETEQRCTIGKNYILTVNTFVSELTDDLNGIYRSEYTRADGRTKVIATSQMEPVGARETFPCFDEPALKANFTVTLWYRSDSGDFALSNMPPHSTKEKTIDGVLWNATTFEESVPMSTYLLALVVCDFSVVDSETTDGIKTRIFARTDSVDNGEADYASEITPKILDFFEEYFKIPYPIAKSDQMAVPDFGAGAMENWGLVIYRETYLLYNETVSSIFEKRRITSVIAHELAHQWFGNLVSPVWWDDIWLNEGFATYMAYLGEDAVQPTWKSAEQFLTDDLHYAMEVDGLTSSHPLVQPVNSPDEISSQFDDISYSKGSSILRMINGFMGQGNFTEGLTNYMTDLAFGSATHGDLFSHWEKQADKAGLQFPVKLTTILETWTLQMGYPVINVSQISSDTYLISQEYFLLDSSATPVQTDGSRKYGYQWYVPFTYKTKNQIGTNEMKMEWLEVDQSSPMTIKESDYLLANIDAVGFYRVNYDIDTWNKLIEIMDSNEYTTISESNRAQLIDDAFNLARPGRLDISVAMNLTKYLTREEDYVPWKTFTNRARDIEYLIARSPVYGTFSNYIVQIIEPLYKKYGFVEDDKSDAAHVKRMTLQLALGTSCYYGSQACTENATRLYDDWMTSKNASVISNTYRNDIYCTAIRNGGATEWNFAWEQHQKSNNAQQQDSLRYGMSCSKEPWILTRYIERCVDRTLIRRQDSLRTCVRYIAQQDYGRDLVWSYLVDNWDELVEEYGSGFTFNSLIEYTTRRFSTEYDLQSLENFKASNDKLGTAVRAVDQAIDRTKVNINWRKLNEKTLSQWLQDNTNETV